MPHVPEMFGDSVESDVLMWHCPCCRRIVERVRKWRLALAAPSRCRDNANDEPRSDTGHHLWCARSWRLSRRRTVAQDAGQRAAFEAAQRHASPATGDLPPPGDCVQRGYPVPPNFQYPAPATKAHLPTTCRTPHKPRCNIRCNMPMRSRTRLDRVRRNHSNGACSQRTDI
jgi:hypothetical protein